MNLVFFTNDRYRVLQCMVERQVQIKDKKIVPLSQQDIADIIGLSKKKVNIIISELKESGYVIQQSPTRGKYSLTDKAIQALLKMQDKGAVCDE
ncbi:MAG: helix-turn-helix domain-containing protein [Clostridia bacterium]